jgi:hypothetical protein
MPRFPPMLSLLCLAFVAGAPALAGPATGSGRAVVVGKVAEQARANARRSALLGALEKAVAAAGGPKSGEDAEFDARVYSRPEAFFTAVEWSNETVEGNVLRVEVTGSIDDALITASIAGRKRATSAPTPAPEQHKRLLVLATEQLGPSIVIAWTDTLFSNSSTSNHLSSKTSAFEVRNESGGMEAAVSDAFSGAGYQVVDVNVLKGKLSAKRSLEFTNLTNDSASSIASKADADYVVIIKGSSRIATSGALADGEMSSGQANATGRLIRVSDGKVMASATEHAAQVHIDSQTALQGALNEAAKLVAEKLARAPSSSP